MEAVNTLYSLESRLKTLYASRDRYAAHEVRWKFRGSWLLLHMAIQAHPSNDSYDIFRDGKRAPDEGMSAADLRQKTTQVSKMPAEPYTNRDSDDKRIDSMFQDTSSTTPPHPQIWLAIFKATNDAAKMTVIAQDLLLWIWPEKKAGDIIKQIGNPARKLSDDDAELRL